ncbi:MAG: type II toxin-antitoxin system RelB/DinJ family antitoxin, partial [Firmicutes bacterium]|nr:type II toxin-antitoxin system RelB/DinJ family antitoxin [Bacillota bacterium]
MPKTATIHARLDEQTKNDALAVFDALGISLSEAITLYFRQVALKNGIPFELTTAINPKNNLERVHEYRRKDLQEILQMLPSSVDELWVFGSSVTPYCRPNSDLDILVVGD